MAKYKIIPSSRTIVQSPISIGHKAEKGVEAIEFDLTAWVETYGSGTLTVIMRRWGDAIPYPIALEIDENNKATWTLSDIDTAKAGMAYAQLNYIVGDEVVKKSDIYTFRVMDSLTGEGEPPEAYESWLEHLTHLAAEAMAEVLDIESIVTDKTLTVDGGIADAKATGDALSALEDQFTEETDKLKADLSNIKPGLSDDAKLALMACLEQVAWKNSNNNNVYLQALATALEIGMRIISGNDLGNYAMWYSAYPYYAASNTRLAYTKLDIPVTGGKIYAIKANTSQSNVNMRIDIYNENILARAANEENISQSDHQLATGDWNALEQAIVMPKMINDSPTAGIICIVRYSDDSNINVGAVDSIVIQEKSVRTVPIDYTEYDYIAVSGTSSVIVDATAVIQTAVYDDLGHANISLDYLATNSLETSNTPIIGVKGENDWAHTVCIYITSGKDYTVHSHGSKVISDAVTKNKINHIDLRQGNASPSIVVANGSKTEITWSQDNTVYGSMYLFANAVYNVSTSFSLSANVQLGQFVIWEADGEPDVYVPVVRNSDSVIGVYNVTRQEFHTCSDITKAKVGHSNCLYQVGNWQ